MSSLNKKETERNLLNKGFKRADKDHRYLIFFYNRKLSHIRTKISHGSVKEIGIELISKMSHQVHLSKSDFIKLANCTMSEEHYIDILKKNNNL